MPVWDAVAVHIRDPWAEAGPTVAEVRITRAHMVARLMAADPMAPRLHTAERRLTVVAQSDVQRPLTAAGLRVMAADPTVGLLLLPTAAEEVPHMAEAEQLHLMEAAVT
jgi:hypothetical protein